MLILACASCFQSTARPYDYIFRDWAQVNIVLCWVYLQSSGKHGLLLILQGRTSLLLSMYYERACFMIQHFLLFFFFFSEEARLNEFCGVNMGMAVIPDTGYSVFKKLIMGFHTSSVGLNTCVRTGTGRGC